MIKSITVTNYLGDSIVLELTRPEKSGFIVESVTGLGPGSSAINLTEISTTDGAYFNSSRVSSRNIVLSLRFMWDRTIEDSRQLSYKYFPLKRGVTLTIETDNRSLQISGYVESNEPNIFSETEGTEISIICPDPFFKDSRETQQTSFSGIEPLFEFPFSNESLTEPLLEFSEIVDSIERVLVYNGDVETGVTISIKAFGEASGITLYNIGTRESMKILDNAIESIMGSGLTDGDEIVICTITGKKSATFIRNGKSTNILNSIDRSSDWFKLAKGSNIFAYTTESGRNNIQVQIQNSVIYEGI